MTRSASLTPGWSRRDGWRVDACSLPFLVYAEQSYRVEFVEFITLEHEQVAVCVFVPSRGGEELGTYLPVVDFLKSLNVARTPRQRKRGLQFLQTSV